MSERATARLAALAVKASRPYRIGWIEGYLSEEAGHTKHNRQRLDDGSPAFSAGFEKGVADYRCGVR